MSNSMQIGIPERVFGNCHYLCHPKIEGWMRHYKLNLSYCGSNLSGTGYDENGVSNRTWSYMVYNINEEDASMFKIQFPECSVYLSERGA